MPVALDLAPAFPEIVHAVDVLSWNIAIGKGDLVRVVNNIRRADRPLIVLAQEAYRADDSVPHELQSRYHGGHAPTNRRIDIVNAATELGFSLRYAPSMRNGDHRSDRGNAILCSHAISESQEFVLPHVRQRRVAMTARIGGVVYVSAHLDTRGRVRETPATGRYGTGRTAQAQALATALSETYGEETIIFGADLNSYLGLKEPLLRELETRGFQRIPHSPGGHTFHAAPLRMLLDHVFLRIGRHEVSGIEVQRLDEDARDRGRSVFGSDHHPLLARVQFQH